MTQEAWFKLWFCDYLRDLGQAQSNMNGDPYGLVSEKIHIFENAIKLEMQFKSLLGDGAGREQTRNTHT